VPISDPEDNLTEVLVTSDWHKEQAVYAVDVQTFRQLIRDVIDDDVRMIGVDESTGKWVHE
jgi:hypothetical protein